MVRTYDKGRMGEKLGKYWTVRELWLNGDMPVLVVDDRLVDALDSFTEHFRKKPGFATRNSIYCSSGHAGNSYHYRGMAADLLIPGVTPLELAQYAERIGMGGVGVYSGWDEPGRHIHIDTGPQRCWWVKTTKSNTPGFGGVPVAFRLGHRSPAIAQLQKRLAEDGYACGKPDGVFGPKTDAALKHWQAAHGIKIDGVFGKMTNTAMMLFSGW